jgi:hypothetical protein
MELTDLASKNLSQLAHMVRRDWAATKSGIYFGARPYLDAMGALSTIDNNYGADGGRSIVAYFLCNASTWRGPVAKAIKAELKRRMNG